MVNDRLHIICGNCGSMATETKFTWEYVPEEITGPDESDPADILITCNNCGTVHSLNRYGKEEKDV